MEFVNLNHVVLHYALKEGRSAEPALVFINSLGSDLRIWQGVEAHLGQERTLLFYDKRGHGLSDVGDQAYSIDRHADDLIALLDYCKLRNVVLCGLSVGGLVALAVYAKRPELVAGLVLSDTAAQIGTPQMWQERIDTIRRDGIAALADPILQRWFSSGFRAHKADRLAGYRNMLVRTPREGYVGTCEAIRDADYTAIARTVAVPTLCLCGDEDGSTPPEVVMNLQQTIPGASFEMIEYAGHLPCVEQPSVVAGFLNEFTMRLTPRGSDNDDK